jgi:hypothetical protein
LARLVVEAPGTRELGAPDLREEGGEEGGREGREAVWWKTWRDMGFDDGVEGREVWPVPTVRRGVAGG